MLEMEGVTKEEMDTGKEQEAHKQVDIDLDLENQELEETPAEAVEVTMVEKHIVQLIIIVGLEVQDI